MKNLFNSIKLIKPKKNMFDLTHDVKLTTEMGRLTPIMVMDCIPGDKVKIQSEAIIRFAPMLAPVMHRIDVYMHYFFVPNRILWDGWEEFITKQDSNKVAPYLTVSANTLYPEATLKMLSYFGINLLSPGEKTGTEDISALPFAAYQCIYNEYYRDQNLQEEVNYKLDDGDNTSNNELFTLRKRPWEHDYFTASLPFAQKGEAVDIPLGSVELDFNAQSNAGRFVEKDNFNNPADGALSTTIVDDGAVSAENTGPAVYDPNGTLKVEPTTINDLRRAFKLQEWLEKNARGGTRYIESILVHFGVKSSDARLQRPEYICGTKTPVVISEVLNSTGFFDDGQGSVTGSAQGTMAGHGIAVASSRDGSYFVEEHGFIVGIMSIRPKTAYQQGIPKMFLRKDSLDYYWPTFANIGEQEVQNREVYGFQGNSAGSSTFGYVPRYAEYKYLPSRVAGDFANNLAYWHLGRIFELPPALNSEFIQCNPRKDIFAVVDENVDSLYCQVLNVVKAVRPMPLYGTPMF